MLKKILLGLLLVSIVGAIVLRQIGLGHFGRHEGPGVVTTKERPADLVAQRAAVEAEAMQAAGAEEPKQILFGDLHVHTTFSFDAFMLSLPLQSGEGAHPPADACDFARHCSALDFWSINDHAEGVTPENWRETVESIRQCNAVAGDAANPDTVAFLGWEWTQVGLTPEEHYGHKNVVLAHTDDARIPARPIAAQGTFERAREAMDYPPVGAGAVAVAVGQPRFHDLMKFIAERSGLGECDPALNTREIGDGCIETARTPKDLFRKLDEWGHDALVIPHGTTWGFYTPPTSDWAKQLTPEQHDPARQTLFEIYSGHGDSEVYRDWQEVAFDGEGRATCPEPTANYLPSCWRAGEIIEARCRAEHLPQTECASRAAEARANAAEAMGQAHLTVPGATSADWLDAGQCQDCRQPAFNYRPKGSAQYVMALRNFDVAGDPLRFRFGFMGSSDNHFARPGTGYKEVNRTGFTESRTGLQASMGPLARTVMASTGDPVARSKPLPDRDSLQGFQLYELERQGSYFMTGGLIAAHSSGRDRASLWDTFQRREVYGTTGQRTLLWFDLLNPPGGGSALPMGSEVVMQEAPSFRVRAVGSLEQLPGCPQESIDALGPERLETVCKSECYNPGNQRRRITRIEVVRIRPQNTPGEETTGLIDDPWRSFACDADSAGCSVTFSDPEYATLGRDALYYARVFEEPRDAINAAGVNCTARDADGRCTAVDLCGIDPADAGDDCLAPSEPRAWSSPIFVDFAPGAAAPNAVEAAAAAARVPGA